MNIINTVPAKDDFTGLEADRGLKSLDERCSAFNLFSAVGVGRFEIRHSRFLAFLLDPSENHGLGDRFLKLFVKSALPNVSSYLGNVVVESESGDGKSRPDIKIVDEVSRFVLVIETKIKAKERVNQTSDYREMIETLYPDRDNWERHYLYLALPGAPVASDPSFVSIDYNLVREVIRCARPNASRELKIILNHYDALLESEIMSDDWDRIAKGVYERHKKAIDYIIQVKRQEDFQRGAREILRGLITEHGGLEFAEGEAIWYLYFWLKSWEGAIPREGKRLILHFEVNLKTTDLFLYVRKRKYPEVAAALLGLKEFPFFKGRGGGRGEGYESLYKVRLADLQENDDPRSLIRTGWNRFTTQDLRLISEDVAGLLRDKKWEKNQS